MSKRSVHVASLRIRIPRRLAGQAATIASGLGKEILRGIAESTASVTGGRKIAAIDPVKVRAGRNVDVRGLQEQVAAQVAQELRKQFE
jgi:hypothetical protein